MVFVDVHTRLGTALIGNAGAGNFSQAVDIIGLDAQLIFNIVTHFLSPGFCTENTGFQMDLIPQALFVDGFGQISSIRRGAAQDGGLQVAHELDLPVGIAGGHGKGQGAYFMRAAIEARAAGEQAVAIAHLHHIAFIAASRHNGAGTAVFPQIQVMLGVESHYPTTSGAAGGLDAHCLLQGHSQQAIGIGVAKVGLGKEGQLV